MTAAIILTLYIILRTGIFLLKKRENKKAEWVQNWYTNTLVRLRHSFTQALADKYINYPDYFPGRHWFSSLENF